MVTTVFGYSLKFSHTFKILFALISFFMVVGFLTWFGAPVARTSSILNGDNIIISSSLLDYIATFLSPYTGNYSVSLSYAFFSIIFFLPSRKIIFKRSNEVRTKRTQKIFGFTVSHSKIIQTGFLFISFCCLFDVITYWGVPIEQYHGAFTGRFSFVFDLASLISSSIYPIIGNYSLSFSFSIFYIFCLFISLSKWEYSAR